MPEAHDSREQGEEVPADKSAQPVSQGQGAAPPCEDGHRPRNRWQRAVAIAAALACVALIGVSGYALAANAPWDVSALFQTTAQDDAEQPASEQADGAPANDAAASEGEKDAGSEADADEAEGGDGGSSSAASSAGSGSKGSSGGVVGAASAGGASSGSSSSSGSAASKPSRVRVSISIDSSAADGRVSYSSSFTFSEGASVYDALCATGVAISSSQSAYGVYVSSIGGLAEKEFGGESGWKYSVNGSVPNKACSAYKLKDGDAVRWFYARSA